MPEPKKEVSGADMLRATLTKPKVDYSENFNEDVPPIVETKKDEVPPTVTAPVVDEAKKKNDLLEQEIARLRLQQETLQQEMLRSQNEILKQVTAKPEVVKEPELTEEQVAELMQTNPIKATRYISEQVARRVREETINELNQQEQVQIAQVEFQKKQQEYAGNIEKVRKENPELADPNHRLTQIVLGLETEMPYLMRIPEGPIKALEIAKARYELELVKTAKTPAASEEKPTEPAEQAKPATPVRETPRAAAMVGGASRGVPPTTGVTLTEEQKLAARRMRLTPEEYAKHLKNSGFRKEEAPKRRVSV